MSTSSPVVLAGGPITRSGDRLRVELHQPADSPSFVMVRWPDAPTITTTTRYTEMASTAMRLLAEASTTLARIKAIGRA